VTALGYQFSHADFSTASTQDGRSQQERVGSGLALDSGTATIYE
jgi:hypothetical protein